MTYHRTEQLVARDSDPVTSGPHCPCTLPTLLLSQYLQHNVTFHSYTFLVSTLLY